MDWVYQPDASGVGVNTNVPGHKNIYRGNPAVTDFLFQWLDTNIVSNSKFDKVRSFSFMTVLFYIIFTITYFFILIGYLLSCELVSSSYESMMSKFPGMTLIFGMLKKIPAVFFAIALVFLAYMTNMTGLNIGNYSLFITGLLFIFVSMSTSCKRWLLLAAGVILCIYSVISSPSGATLLTNMTMITTMFKYTSIVAIILILVDGFVTVPKCNRLK